MILISWVGNRMLSLNLIPVRELSVRELVLTQSSSHIHFNNAEDGCNWTRSPRNLNLGLT
jgi:hypothetical protein